jgi:hypothetical protein
MTVPLSATEVELFQACTNITLGDGAIMSFWHDQWLQGQAPKEIAPTMLRFVW